MLITPSFMQYPHYRMNGSPTATELPVFGLSGDTAFTRRYLNRRTTPGRYAIRNHERYPDPQTHRGPSHRPRTRDQHYQESRTQTPERPSHRISRHRQIPDRPSTLRAPPQRKTTGRHRVPQPHGREHPPDPHLPERPGQRNRDQRKN